MQVEPQRRRGLVDRSRQYGDMGNIEVVSANSERVTVRAGNVFYKIDPNQDRIDAETAAMTWAPVPTPEILWRTPPVLALSALPGTALDQLDTLSTATRQAWAAAGVMIRRVHDAPLPPWPGRGVQSTTAELEDACTWLVTRGVLPANVVARNRGIAGAALRTRPPVFTHGDLQPSHLFVDRGQVTGILDWSEAAPGDGLYDLATLTLAHPEHLDDVITSPGTAPMSTSTSSAPGGHYEACAEPAGSSSTASIRRQNSVS